MLDSRVLKAELPEGIEGAGERKLGASRHWQSPGWRGG